MKRLTILMIACALSAACGKDTSGTGSDTGDDCEGARCAAGDTGQVPGNNGEGSDAGNNGVEPDSGSEDPDLGTADSGGEADMGPASRCEWKLPAADRTRKVVVAKTSFEGDPSLEVLDLSQTGELTQTGSTLMLRGRSTSGTIQFTPDGQYGYIAQEFNLDAGGNDRTMGIFRFSSSGAVELVSADFDPGFYVSRIVMDPSGDAIWGWESGWRENGGAIYKMEIDCATGLPGDPILVGPAKLVKGISFLDSTRAIVAATDILEDETPNNLHLVDFMELAQPARLSSIGIFPDDTDNQAIIDSLAVTRDGKYAVASNAGLFATHNLGIAAIEGDALRFVQNIEVGDPSAIAMSPHNDAMIVLSVQEDTINLLSYDPANTTTPFELVGPVDASSATPLPASLTTVDRGNLNGVVIVSENVAIRVLQFQPGSEVTELDLFDYGPNAGAITGAIGVQP